ncbi:MAG: TRAP transporter small permease [Nitrospinaceae bacterium]|nr:TRAP transporter small permease [Nitrospinaceae bacterium]MBT5869832.1 TRAP transporter small permease [Nitrospinaceae bacterium]
MTILNQIDRFLEKIEHHLIVIILSLMILLSFGQMLLRNVFDMGFVWGDTLLRQGVLWVGFLGAAIAVKQNKHISIDVFSNLSSAYWKRLVSSFTKFFAAIISGFLTWSAWSFMQFEKESQSILVLDIPVWIFQTILPYSFMIISLRFMIGGFKTAFIQNDAGPSR